MSEEKYVRYQKKIQKMSGIHFQIHHDLVEDTGMEGILSSWAMVGRRKETVRKRIVDKAREMECLMEGDHF